MLDAFGFDPAYPGLMAAAGLTESSWARGPFHQWGPGRTAGDNRLMQFAAEFEWLSPDGAGLLTSYMANHYSAGWGMQQAGDLAAAEHDAYEQFRQLAPVAATRNVLLPVGGDHVVPSRWAAAIHRDWNARYTWPRFVTALPREFFAAVREDAARGDVWITPQTRDMNPVYTGKDVSYTDTKQAQRQAEVAVLDAERLATLAWLAGAPYPAASIDKAWRLLAFGAHHDAITGTEGDQVYLDLLAGWREAWQRGADARASAAEFLAGLADTAGTARAAAARAAAGAATGAAAGGPDAAAAGTAGADARTLAIVVLNTLSAPRSALATAVVRPPGPAGWLELTDDGGLPVPFLAQGVSRHPDGSLAEITITFRAAEVPATGYRTYLARLTAPAVGAADASTAGAGPEGSGWQPAAGHAIENDRFAVTADPARGGTLTSVRDKRTGTELLSGPGNELVLQPEHARHPRWGEGPWLLCPAGPGPGSSGLQAEVTAERCPAGQRLVVRLRLDDLQVTQETLLWDSAERVEFRTHVDGSIGSDKLLRVAFPAHVPGGLPVFHTAVSVIGRPPGPADTDVADNPFTLDNPANEWFGIGSAARVALTAAPGADGSGGGPQYQAIGVAEVITPRLPGGDGAAGLTRAGVRALLAALARQGVTATTSFPDGPRYGNLEVDSNLPDFRIVLGGPELNACTAAILAAAGPDPAGELARQLGATGTARVWVPAARSRADAFGDRADVRGLADLPVLIIAGSGDAELAAAVAAVTDDLADAVIEVPATAADAASDGGDPGGPAEAAGDPGGPAAIHRAGRPGDGAGGPATALAGHSVAVLNRGTPSSLVTPGGVATMALMRACSSWPCGVWIDGPARFAPDGTSFAWQHWSHTFEYALAAGPGDWRSAGFAAAGQDYNTPLLTVVTGLHAGPLPGRASLASVEPATALLDVLKPRGNPLAPGPQPRPADGLTIRLRNAGSRPGPAQVRLFASLTGARQSALLEDAAGEPVPVSGGMATVWLPAAGVTTIAATPAPVPWAGPAGPEQGRPGQGQPDPGQPTAGQPDPGLAEAGLPEPAQPVYARYWLHGKGPAPAGNMPVAVHLSPGQLAVPPDGPRSLRLTVACGPDPAAGQVRLTVPDGVTLPVAGLLTYDLPARGHACWDLAVSLEPGAGTAARFVTAAIEDLAGQVIEDAALITAAGPDTGGAGTAGPDTAGAEAGGRAETSAAAPEALAAAHDHEQQALAAEIELTVPRRELALGPGQTGAIEVRVTNRAACAIHGEAQLISPAGTWDCLPRWDSGFRAEPGATTVLDFPVTVPVTARPGQRWWALAKIMYFGRARYSEPVEVIIS
jgi:hypothetical protein